MVFERSIAISSSRIIRWRVAATVAGVTPIGEMLEQLKADKDLSRFAEFIFAQAPDRNPVSGRISVQFRLRYNKPPAEAKK